MRDVEKLREEILAIVAAAGKPISAPAILQEAKHADDREQFSQTLFYMSKTGELKKHPAPEGSGIGVRFLYGIGDGKPRKAAAGGGDSKPRRAAHKAPRRAAKVHRRNATSRQQREPHGQGITGWVLTAEGAFVLLGRKPAIQIKAESARSIVELVRAGADLDGLVEFIKKLDEGRA